MNAKEGHIRLHLHQVQINDVLILGKLELDSSERALCCLNLTKRLTSLIEKLKTLHLLVHLAFNLNLANFCASRQIQHRARSMGHCVTVRNRLHLITVNDLHRSEEVGSSVLDLLHEKRLALINSLLAQLLISPKLQKLKTFKLLASKLSNERRHLVLNLAQWDSLVTKVASHEAHLDFVKLGELLQENLLLLIIALGSLHKSARLLPAHRSELFNLLHEHTAEFSVQNVVARASLLPRLE